MSYILLFTVLGTLLFASRKLNFWKVSIGAKGNKSSEKATVNSGKPKIFQTSGEYVVPVIEPVAADFDWQKAEPFKYRPFKAAPYKMTLAIRNLEPSDLFLIEDTYLHRTNIREKVLNSKFKKNTCLLHDSAIPAVREFYDMAINFMCDRYPMYFTKSKADNSVYNEIRKESVPLDPYKVEDPETLLLALGKTLEEDYLILLKNGPEGEEGEYYLRAGISGFPAGFDPSQKFNMKLSDIHGPVPMYQSKLKLSMNKFFSRINPGQFVIRNNWSVQAHCKLFAVTENHAPQNEIIEAMDGSQMDFNKVLLRVERQCLTRLPNTRANVFVIRTYLTPVTYVKDEGLGEELCGAIDGLPDVIKQYKRAEAWGPAVKKFMTDEEIGLTGETYMPEILAADL
ncbi:hypothetical protein BABINDRAFT_161076 [Babjeviella inositovora NRRL Y-12698]|uniref:Uncharacterized protein n=1 Tax=Babjeviella inositovora NRRL Y-12698 TaxID=984486 RepID=A0A1E3QV99_9ASCO|nr:uncharacterized protein BABINDRAFT_161076 [Babjeviella inositovora NRRL Y-12698]ODQ80887.1 hypothetical protein BABINDRAFT_161076 [Babjeviella inositovora NRRL Y-12698]